jgi:hypothetical protein
VGRADPGIPSPRKNRLHIPFACHTHDFLAVCRRPSGSLLLFQLEVLAVSIFPSLVLFFMQLS